MALSGKNKVIPIFIFDSNILEKLPKQDARVEFILSALGAIDIAMKRNRCNVGIYHGTPKAVLEKLLDKWSIEKVVCNEDYEPYASQRDREIKDFLEKKNIGFEQYKDQVIFAKDEVVKDDGTPYKIYTPYSRKWISHFESLAVKHFPSEELLGRCYNEKDLPTSSLSNLGFSKSSVPQPKHVFNDTLIDEYEATRNFPYLDKTSRIGTALRFGTLSVRKAVLQAAARSNSTFLKELIWREFFMQILWHFPHTQKNSFKPQYDRIEWRNDENDFKKWCAGETGYPLVDAGMRELNETGFMHNRVRMLVGSFLCKHLLIDWRWGEAYFAEKLLDYEMSSNVGNWQWVAGCGVDAAPYFRIFNPTEQVKKFDKELRYIKKWVSNFQDLDYPQPIVDHKMARERCLNTFKAALNTV
jgi:deoxyribodipyrimidine photo-lyase